MKSVEVEITCKLNLQIDDNADIASIGDAVYGLSSQFAPTTLTPPNTKITDIQSMSFDVLSINGEPQSPLYELAETISRSNSQN